MLDKKTEAKIDGNDNIVIQNVSGKLTIINMNDTEEIRRFLIDFSQETNELPREIIMLLKEKSQKMTNEIKQGANLYLTVFSAISDVTKNSVLWGTTITNLTREIRYFNQPYFKVYPKFQLDEGIEHDTFFMMQDETSNVRFPYRLEFGQTISCKFPVKSQSYKLYEKINQEEGSFIQAFVTTTLGEIYNSRKYPISKFIQIYQNTLNLKL